MSAQFVLWVTFWPWLVVSLCAIAVTSKESRWYQCGPVALACMLAVLIADRGLSLMGDPTTIAQNPLRPYINVGVVLAATYTIAAMSRLLNARCGRWHDEHELGSS